MRSRGCRSDIRLLCKLARASSVEFPNYEDVANGRDRKSSAGHGKGLGTFLRGQTVQKTASDLKILIT